MVLRQNLRIIINSCILTTKERHNTIEHSLCSEAAGKCLTEFFALYKHIEMPITGTFKCPHELQPH